MKQNHQKHPKNRSKTIRKHIINVAMPVGEAAKLQKFSDDSVQYAYGNTHYYLVFAGTCLVLKPAMTQQDQCPENCVHHKVYDLVEMRNSQFFS